MAKYSVTVDLTVRETWLVDASSADEALAAHEDGTLVDTEVVSIDPLFADLLED